MYFYDVIFDKVFYFKEIMGVMIKMFFLYLFQLEFIYNRKYYDIIFICYFFVVVINYQE